MLMEVPDDQLGSVTLAGIVPKLSRSPGGLKWSGGAVGKDNEYVLADLLGLSKEELRELEEESVVSDFDVVTQPRPR